MGAVAYSGGSLSVDSGDYFFIVETLCNFQILILFNFSQGITPSTCPATIIPGDGLRNNANPTIEEFGTSNAFLQSHFSSTLQKSFGWNPYYINHKC